MAMQIHASCATFHGAGVLLLGRSGIGKSDLLLRLLDIGFDLVADDRVDVDRGWARVPPMLGGLLEVRGIGILRMPYVEATELRLAVDLDQRMERLPTTLQTGVYGCPLIGLDPRPASAAIRVRLAIACLTGRVVQLAGSTIP